MTVVWTWLVLKCISQHFLIFELEREVTRCGEVAEKTTALQRKGAVLFFRIFWLLKKHLLFSFLVHTSHYDSARVGSYHTGLSTCSLLNLLFYFRSALSTENFLLWAPLPSWTHSRSRCMLIIAI